MSWDELPVVVTVAPVGAEVTRADNLRRGTLAASNAGLVADVCELVRMLGPRPATIDETRELLACPVR